MKVETLDGLQWGLLILLETNTCDKRLLRV